MTNHVPSWERGDTAPLHRVNSAGWPVPNQTAGTPQQAGSPEQTQWSGQQGMGPPYGPPPASATANQPTTSGGPSSSPSTASRRDSILRWTLRGAGLCAVAVVSGLAWLALKPADPAAGPPPEQGGEFSFAQQWMDRQTSCSAHSIAQIKTFFQQRPCSGMVRTLHSTDAPGGSRVLTSVITVRMPDAGAAAELEKLTHDNNTGNVNDLVTAGVAKIPGGPESMPDHGYASTVRGNDVILAESNFYGADRGEDPVLRRISNDALRLGENRA